MVAPATHVPTIRRPAVTTTKPHSPDGLLNVPSVLRTQYSMDNDDKGSSTGRKQAVTGFLGQTYVIIISFFTSLFYVLLMVSSL